MNIALLFEGLLSMIVRPSCEDGSHKRKSLYEFTD